MRVEALTSFDHDRMKYRRGDTVPNLSRAVALQLARTGLVRLVEDKPEKKRRAAGKAAPSSVSPPDQASPPMTSTSCDDGAMTRPVLTMRGRRRRGGS